MSQHAIKKPSKAGNVALRSNILWPVRTHFCGTPSRRNMLTMPKSASDLPTFQAATLLS